MKMNKTIWICILIILSYNTMIMAQDKEIGVDIGYGISGEHGYIKSKYFLLGINYNIHPVKAPFVFKTGITYDYREFNGLNINYLRSPLGLDFIIGRKFNLIIGGGFYLSYLVSYNKKESIPNFEETKSRFQFGGEFNGGISYQISEKIEICLMSQINLDISKIYDYPDLSPGGASTPYPIKGIDIFCKLGFRYKLSKNY